MAIWTMFTSTLPIQTPPGAIYLGKTIFSFFFVSFVSNLIYAWICWDKAKIFSCGKNSSLFWIKFNLYVHIVYIFYVSEQWSKRKTQLFRYFVIMLLKCFTTLGVLILFSRPGLFSERIYIRANLFGLCQEWRNNRNMKKKRDAWCYLSLVEHCFPFYHFLLVVHYTLFPCS